MAELANWGPEDFEIHASKISNTPLVPRPPPPPPTSSPTTTAAETSPPPPPIPYLLSCHDYKGGYHPSEACQGQFPAPATPIYSAVHLNVIDTFIYFSHNLVSIPPAPWINTLHRNGVRALGTFIVEHASGSTALTRLFDKGSEGEYIFATKLAQITEIYGFDGWLMNIEAVFPRESFSPGELQAFLTELRSGVKELVPGGEVIWYDALTVLNQVHWQNGLTLLNVPFFKVSDGLFTNYGWREGQLEATRAMAGTMGRVQDVYSGVDCFGRGSLGDGGFGVGEALSAIHKVGTSAALFAPGWTFEHFDGENFESIDRKFWVGDGSDVESNPVKPVSYFVSEKPCGGSQFFYTSFNRAFGKGWWIDGVVRSTPQPHFPTHAMLIHCNRKS
ncbi:hypothetical protein L873DRAFT_1792791 [Choiromyces venosus 120613-1]|uniref:Cytosolic endo-beta-N-acetylglucosaminidase TIM barrel domain-containing protein n=1 Tax=Choiromyces venosus 120613-1 TaxID=1336337 RepID=A0A3N4J8V1_9PEZI|nr:hypothetical protein L873DRAFT_1792791 [Choiromyces venosus 120613-1]